MQICKFLLHNPGLSYRRRNLHLELTFGIIMFKEGYLEEVRVLDNYSYEDYLDIANSTEQRVELIFGKIYMKAGASALHQDVVGNIFFKLKSDAKDGCKPRVAPFDVKLEINGIINIVQPDVMIFCNNIETPCAIFEVLSPLTALKDKTVKKELYELAKIEEYFLVNAEYKIIEKFELVNNRYELVGVFGKDDKIEVKCINQEVELKEIFEV